MNGGVQPIETLRPGLSLPADKEGWPLVAALRRRDEAAFCALVERYHRSLLRVAQSYVPDAAVAEEIVQETWMALLLGITRFEARSTLKTWLFHVLAHQANRRVRREARSVSFSELEKPAVDSNRLDPPGAHRRSHWSEELPGWEATPEERLLAGETREQIEQLIAQLPERQRQVIVLRDVEGLSAAETCAILEIPDQAQRLLLHRARARVRARLAAYILEDEETIASASPA